MMKSHLAFACLSLALLSQTVWAEPGVTGDTILLGQSAAFSGPAAELGKDLQQGAQAYFNYVNDQGGIYGRKIRLISLDDGYEPARALENTNKLLKQNQVFALFGYVGTPTSYAVLPSVTEAKVPFIGAFSGADGLRHPVNHYVFNVRASYNDETDKLVGWLNSQDRHRIAVFYQNDAYGKAGLSGVQKAMDARGQKIVATGIVERNSVQVDEAVRKILAAKPDGVILISAYSSCAAFIKKVGASTKDDISFANVSFVGSRALANELGEDGNAVIVSQVVPFPLDPGLPLARQFRALLAKYSPDAIPSFNNFEGFIAAKALAEGLTRAGQQLTREGLVRALEGFQRADLGGFYVSYSPDSHEGSKFVQLTMILGGKSQFVYMY